MDHLVQFIISNAFGAYRSSFDYPFDTDTDCKDGVIGVSLCDHDHGLKETIFYGVDELFNLERPTYEIYQWLCEMHEKLSKGE